MVHHCKYIYSRTPPPFNFQYIMYILCSFYRWHCLLNPSGKKSCSLPECASSLHMSLSFNVILILFLLLYCLGKSCNRSTSFPCGNGICLPLSNKCDDFIDCPGGSDEMSCDQRQFTSCFDWWLAGYRINGEYNIGRFLVTKAIYTRFWRMADYRIT